MLNQNANAGLWHLVTDGYENDLGCAENFVGIGDLSLPADGEAACTANKVIISGFIYETITTGPFAIFGGLGLAAYIGGLAIAATSGQNNSSLCTYEIHPMPLVDSQIMELLKKQGKHVSIRSVSEYYDKICVEHKGDQFWLGKDECVWNGGLLWCTTYPDWSDSMLCGVIASTCPCIGSIAAGSFSDPNYEKDSEGYIKTDANGNPKVKNEEGFNKYFAKHCNMISIDSSMPLLPLEYTGIIDDICNTWKGYSKANISLTSGPIQCLQSTMENIFHKPIFGDDGGEQGGSFHVPPELKPQLDALEKDAVFVKNLIADIQELILSADHVSLKTDPKVSEVARKVLSCINRSAFSSKYKKDYNTGVVEISITDNDNNDTISANLNQTLSGCFALQASIQNRTKSFLESVQSSGKKNITMFETMQGQAKLISFFIILLYITIVGMKIMFGTFDVSMRNILKNAIQLAIVYYFSLGDAWKEYFYRMIFDASIGMSEILFESVTNDSSTDKKCNFVGNYYVEDKDKDCIFPNAALGGDVTPQYLKDDSRGNKIYVCQKGPFIFRPQYERPYKAVIYHEIGSSGSTIKKAVPMFCKNKGTGESVIAKLISDDITGEPKRWKCDTPYVLEEGYRLGVLSEIGIDVYNVDTSLGSTDFLPTAVFSLNEDQDIVDLFPPHSSSVAHIKEKIIRFKTIEAAETKRNTVNQRYRRYPEIEKYGVKRNFDYVALFDMVDCKLINYFQYDSVAGFSMLANFDFCAILFGGIIIIIMFLSLLWMGIFLIAMVGRIVQSYLVAIIAITILVYFTPIILPLSLFEQTKEIAKDWKDKIIGYAALPAILFMSTGIAFSILDYSFYGAPATFQSKQMFNKDGKINGFDCWEDDLWSAPSACLVAKIGQRPTIISFLGLHFRVPDPKVALVAAFAILKTIIIIFMLQKIVTQFESTMSSLMGVNADISLEGSVFNDPGDLQNKIKSVPGKVKDKISAAVKKNRADAAKKDKGKDGDKDKDKEGKDDKKNNDDKAKQKRPADTKQKGK